MPVIKATLFILCYPVSRFKCRAPAGGERLQRNGIFPIYAKEPVFYFHATGKRHGKPRLPEFTPSAFRPAPSVFRFAPSVFPIYTGRGFPPVPCVRPPARTRPEAQAAWLVPPSRGRGARLRPVNPAPARRQSKFPFISPDLGAKNFNIRKKVIIFAYRQAAPGFAGMPHASVPHSPAHASPATRQPCRRGRQTASPFALNVLIV